MLHKKLVFVRSSIEVDDFINILLSWNDMK
jgi:hypothetical protein